MASFCNFYAGEDHTQASHCWNHIAPSCDWNGDSKVTLNLSELIPVASFCNFYPHKEHTQASPRLPESRCSKL